MIENIRRVERTDVEPRPGLTEGGRAVAALDGPVGLEQALLDAENSPLVRAGHGELAEREMRTLLLARRPAPRLPVPGRATILLKKKRDGKGM